MNRLLLKMKEEPTSKFRQYFKANSPSYFEFFKTLAALLNASDTDGLIEFLKVKMAFESQAKRGL